MPFVNSRRRAPSQRGYVISFICGPSVETLDPDTTISVVVDSLTCEASKHGYDDHALLLPSGSRRLPTVCRVCDKTLDIRHSKRGAGDQRDRVECGVRHSSKKYMRLSHVLVPSSNRHEQALLLLLHLNYLCSPASSRPEPPIL